jgi:hypothetical protein
MLARTSRDNSLDLRRIMDGGKILLVNLAKGKIGEDTSSLLGAFLVARLGRTALRRADTPETERRDFYVYLDEFPTFATLSRQGSIRSKAAPGARTKTPAASTTPLRWHPHLIAYARPRRK